MEQRVLAGIREDFQVGSEDWNDVLFTGHGLRWMKDSQSPSIEVSQERAKSCMFPDVASQATILLTKPLKKLDFLVLPTETMKMRFRKEA